MSANRAPRIGVDLDGVLYNFALSLHRHLHGTEEGFTEPQHWHFYRDAPWGMTDAEFVKACDAAVNSGAMFGEGDCARDDIDALAFLLAQRYSLHIATDRSFGEPGRSAANTLRWLRTHSIPFDSITFTADKTVVDVDYFIDDKIENYDALDAAGVHVMLLNRPWNQDPGDDRRRVDSVWQFTDTVIDVERRNRLDTVWHDRLDTVWHKWSHDGERSQKTFEELLADHVRDERMRAGETLAPVIDFPTTPEPEIVAPTDQTDQADRTGRPVLRVVGEEVRTTSTSGASKGVKPEAMDLIPTVALRSLGRVYGFGRAKYAPVTDAHGRRVDNWRLGYEYSKSYAAAMRHLTAFWSGEDIDPESGESHLMHAAWHCFAMRTWHEDDEIRAMFDDRQDNLR